MALVALETIVFGYGEDGRIIGRGQSFTVNEELAQWLIENGKAVRELQPDFDEAGRLRINIATAERIDEVLDGIGPETANGIVNFREVNGPFRSIDDLLKVNGIGKRLLQSVRGRLTVE